jgi:hypothetical protein
MSELQQVVGEEGVVVVKRREDIRVEAGKCLERAYFAS